MTFNFNNFFDSRNKNSKMGDFQDLDHIDGLSVSSVSANLYSKIITGMPIKDATGGFKAWKAGTLRSINLDQVKSSGYSFQIEMNFRAWHKGKKLVEHPIIFIDRTVGESKMSKAIMFEAVWMVWRLRMWRIFRMNK